MPNNIIEEFQNINEWTDRNFSNASKEEMYKAGVSLVLEFGMKNSLPILSISMVNQVYGAKNKFQATGNYTGGSFSVNIDKASHVVTRPYAMKWSFPGNKTDRTPFGVVAHEYSHFIYDLYNMFRVPQDVPFKRLIDTTEYRDKWIKDVKGSAKISSYEPTLEEQFAEAGRLFITNPDLLKKISPKRYKFLREDLKLTPVIKTDWKTTLKIRGADDMYIKNLE